MNLSDINRLIGDTLRAVGMWNAPAQILVLATGLQESGYERIYQMGGGPARSFWQVEPATALDHVESYLCYRDPLRERIARACGLDPGLLVTPDPETLERILALNLGFAIIMARLKYWREPLPLPPIAPRPMGEYWKHIYNTTHGAGTVDEFVAAWERNGIEKYI